MPSTVPTPVAAALGIVPTVLGGVRRLPGKAISLPVYAISSALTSFERSRREYDALAERGERLIARLRGVRFDEVEDRFEDALQGTPLAAPYDAVEDALEDAAENVTALVRNAPGTVRKAPARARKAASTATVTTGRALDRAADTVEDLSASAAGNAKESLDEMQEAATATVDLAEDTVTDAVEATRGAVDEATGTAADALEPAAGTDAAGTDTAGTDTAGTDTAGTDTAETGTAKTDTPEDEAPKGVPTPKATEPDSTRVGTAADTDVVDTVEQVSSVVGGEVLSHDELPLPDYDHMTLGSLRGRMRSLDVPQLVQIRDYEKAHADRLPIVTMLDNRIAKLATDPSAPLSGGSPVAQDAAKPKATRKGSKVSPATGGPAQNPPTAGVPTNPAQPRTGTAGTNPDSDA